MVSHLLLVPPPAEVLTSEQPDPLKASEKPVLCPAALKAQVLSKPERHAALKVP